MEFKLHIVVKPTKSSDFYFEELVFDTREDAEAFSIAYAQARDTGMGISEILEVEESEPEAES
jgi:hypothetical protein